RAPEPTRVANAVVKAPGSDATISTPAAPGSPVNAPVAKEAPKSEAGLGLPPRYGLKLKILPTCQVPGVRAFLVYKRLSNIGNVFDLRPALEDLKAGRIPEGLISLELESGAGEAGVVSTLKNVSEVELVSIRLIPQNAPPTAPPPPSAAPAAPEGPK